MIDWSTQGKCLIIAHRGFTKNCLENTLGAVEAALKLGCHGVEVDIRMTRDGELVLFHDETLNRLSDQGGRIEEMTISGVRQVVLEGKHQMPSLEELLDLTGDKILINLEIKTVRLRGPQVEEKLVRTLRSFHLGPTALISCFHPLPLWRLKKIEPQLKRGYLVSERHVWSRPRETITKRIQPFSLNPSPGLITPSFIEEHHQAGRRIFVWTVNEKDVMRRLSQVGIDGIFTDRPDEFLSLHGDQ